MKVTIEAITEIVRVGGFVSRQQIAEGLGREKATTWIINNIESAVSAGVIERLPATVSKQPGWGYCLPEYAKGLGF